MPMTSRPERITGKPWIWIGVGRVIPLRLSSFRIGAGNFISLNVLMGGGMSTPSTMMCHFSRSSSHCSFDNARMCAGGFHPVSIDWVYETSFASSFADINAFFSLMLFRIAASSSASFCAGVTAAAINLSPAARDRSDVVSFAGANSRTFGGASEPGSAASEEGFAPAAAEVPGGGARASVCPRRAADALTA